MYFLAFNGSQAKCRLQSINDPGDHNTLLCRNAA